MSKTSDNDEAVVPAEVRDLISESRTIQGWMDRLAGHEGKTDPAVFARVQSDYRGRLDGITGKLVQHRSDLVSSRDARQSEVDTLQADRDARAGELEEARLRHAVGEYSDSKWNDRKKSIDGSLSELDELLSHEREAVDELAGIIDSIGEGGTPLAAAPSPAADAADAAGGPQPVAGPSVKRPPAKPPAAGQKDDKDDKASKEAADAAREGEETESAAAAPASTADTKAAAKDGAKGDDDVEGTDDVEITVEAGDDEPTDAGTSEPEKAPAASPAPEVAAAADAGGDDEEAGDYLDELEFLESLSLEESDKFDAVSAMLDDEESSEK